MLKRSLFILGVASLLTLGGCTGKKSAPSATAPAPEPAKSDLMKNLVALELGLAAFEKNLIEYMRCQVDTPRSHECETIAQKLNTTHMEIR